jgi:hydrogenase-4 component E
MDDSNAINWLESLNALTGGLFLLTTFGLVAMRQVNACLRLFIALSILLSVSAFLLSAVYHNWHLIVIGVVDLVTKAIVIPWLLRRALRDEVYTRREITQVLNIPTSLLAALGLTVVAYILSTPLLAIGDGVTVGLNLPIGLAGLLIGGLTAAVRREAVPLFLGLLAMENSAFFAGIGVAPEMPLIAEVSIAFDVVILVFIVSVLTHAVHEHIGTTEVSELTILKEETKFLRIRGKGRLSTGEFLAAKGIHGCAAGLRAGVSGCYLEPWPLWYFPRQFRHLASNIRWAWSDSAHGRHPVRASWDSLCDYR